MNAKLLKARRHIDTTGFRCRFVSSTTERAVLHTHEFYEIFLCQTPGLSHNVNNQSFSLRDGELIFVRPHDVHFITHTEPYNFINLAFSKEFAQSLFLYLEDELPSKLLLDSPTSPSILLSETEKNQVEALLNQFNVIDSADTVKMRIHCKMILSHIFCKYFSNYKHTITDATPPPWFSDVCSQMLIKENFIEGASAMVRISGKSYTHLCRLIKKYYNQTMNTFINDIRLNYAVNLIKQSNLSITDIAYECGFSSHNWFDTCFKAKYGISPNSIRRSRQTNR